MKIAALLSDVQASRSAIRYLEIGNSLVRRGHAFTLFTSEGLAPPWFSFSGEIRPLADLGAESFEIGMCSDYAIVDGFEQLRADARWFYFVHAGHNREKEIAHRNYRFLGNSEALCRRMELRYPITCHRAPGGINPDIFHPPGPGEREERKDTEFRVICHGRIENRSRALDRVIRAVEPLCRKNPNIRLIFFDTPSGLEEADSGALIRARVPCEFHLELPPDGVARLFSRGDIFVDAERRVEWSAAAAEAMACGLPVVCVPDGARDFAVDGVTALTAPLGLPFLIRHRIVRLMSEGPLRARLSGAGSAKILDFTWDFLAARLERIFGRT